MDEVLVYGRRARPAAINRRTFLKAGLVGVGALACPPGLSYVANTVWAYDAYSQWELTERVFRKYPELLPDRVEVDTVEGRPAVVKLPNFALDGPRMVISDGNEPA